MSHHNYRSSVRAVLPGEVSSSYGNRKCCVAVIRERHLVPSARWLCWEAFSVMYSAVENVYRERQWINPKSSVNKCFSKWKATGHKSPSRSSSVVSSNWSQDSSVDMDRSVTLRNLKLMCGGSSLLQQEGGSSSATESSYSRATRYRPAQSHWLIKVYTDYSV